MEKTIKELATEVKQVILPYNSVSKQWEATLEQLGNNHTNIKIAIVYSESSNPNDLLAWLVQQGYEAVTSRAADLSKEVTSIEGYAFVIILTAATKFIPLEDVSVFENLMFSRPKQSFAIVYNELDNLKTDEDYADLISSIGDLFIKPLWGANVNTISQLSEFNCFLWTKFNSSLEIINQSRDEFLGLLKRQSQDSKTTLQLLTSILDKAYDAISEEETKQSQTKKPSFDKSQVEENIDEIRSLSKKVVRRLDDCYRETERLMHNTLRQAESEMRTQWQIALQNNGTNLAKDSLEKVLENGLQKWLKDIGVNQAVLDNIKDASQPINTFDWEITNKIFQQTNTNMILPDELYLSNSHVAEVKNWETNADKFAFGDSIPKGLEVNPIQVGVATTLVVGIGYFIGVVPAAITSAVLMGTYKYNQNKVTKQKIQNRGMQLIAETVLKQEQRVREKLPAVFDPVRQHFDSKFKILIRTLEDIADYELLNSKKTETYSSETLTQLRIIRKQISTLTGI